MVGVENKKAIQIDLYVKTKPGHKYSYCHVEIYVERYLLEPLGFQYD